MTLECEATGDPKPTITWRKNFVPINFFDAFSNGYVLEDNGNLHIPNVQINDAGAFACVVENAAGVVTKEFSLTVHGEYPLHFTW